MTVQEWLRLTISRLQARKNRARDSHQKASIGGQICMAHRALNIIEAHTIPATWHPINPADPATLPGEDDADERGMVWVSFSGDSSHSMSHWQCVTDRFVSTVTLKPIYATHWSPRIKQVPPVWESDPRTPHST